MNVTLSVPGRFHAFDLAWQLQRRGHLGRLITSYPESKVLEWKIDPRRIRTILSHELLSRGWRALAGRMRWKAQPQHLFNCRFDRIAARHVPNDTEICVAWSGSALDTHRRARELGATTVLERNSSHIVFQRDILTEEYAMAGSSAQLPDPRTVDRELEEYTQADFICVPSSFARRTFLEKGVSAAKVFTVPFGVDAAGFQPEPKQDKVFRVIHCGSLSIRKGVHNLLQAFHELRLPSSELWLIGPMTGEIAPYLQRFGGPNVIIKGAVAQNSLSRYYSQGSVFCLPSLEDGFAMVITQAMICGLPVIVSTNTTAHDVVRDGVDGFVIPIRCVESIKDRLSILYADRERCRGMGASARQQILNSFTWDHFGERMTAQYQRILTSAHTLQEAAR